MTNQYTSDAIEVLNGLDPVKRRPGMYTDTTRPNHLGQEVIDNSVDEALAGHATKIEVVLHTDNSLEVTDDGRGMPVDIHPEEGIPGVELILTKLHAGGKFSNKNYQFSGGLHGVGISVVNALSRRVEVTVRRDGQVYDIAFENGFKVEELKVTGTCGRRNTGTRVHFWPDASYFDSANFSNSKLIYLLRAKAVLCPGLRIKFTNKHTNEVHEWYYESGLTDYLKTAVGDNVMLPEEPFIGSFKGQIEAADWAITWLPEGGESINESYVNLIPTPLGGTHVNGFRQGLLESMREFCEFRNLIPRGIKLSPEDIWDRAAFILSVKMQDPQFAGQTKEKLSSRQSSAFVSGIVRDAFSLWLNSNTELAESLAEMCINNAQKRLKAAKKVARKKVTSGPALPGKLTDCSGQDPASQEVHDISVAIGCDPDSNDISELRYGKICILADADSDGLHIATLLCALFLKHYRVLVEQGHVYIAMPPLFRIDIGKDVYYALDEAEKEGVLDRINAENKKGKVQVTRFKGLGEMNPLQLRETTMDPNTRRLVQLTIDDAEETDSLMDMLLAKKRSPDRKNWLEDKGDMAVL